MFCPWSWPQENDCLTSEGGEVGIWFRLVVGMFPKKNAFEGQMRRGEKFELAQAYDLLKAHYIQDYSRCTSGPAYHPCRVWLSQAGKSVQRTWWLGGFRSPNSNTNSYLLRKREQIESWVNQCKGKWGKWPSWMNQSTTWRSEGACLPETDELGTCGTLLSMNLFHPATKLCQFSRLVLRPCCIRYRPPVCTDDIAFSWGHCTKRCTEFCNSGCDTVAGLVKCFVVAKGLSP